MAVEDEGQGTPATGSGSESGKKKIAGKFDTLEQAVEEGYVGLEKLVMANSEKVAALTKVLEAALTADPGPPPEHRSGYVTDRGTDPYGRRQPPEEDRINPADFITNPEPYLAKREEKLLQGVVRIVTDALAGREAVDNFKRSNPDLVRHEKLVKAFMRETDPRKSVADRLEDAGKAAREYLATMKAEFAGGHSRVPAGNDYVETPRGPGSPGGPVPPVIGEDDEAEKKELADYIRERQQDYAGHFGGNIKKE